MPGTALSCPLEKMTLLCRERYVHVSDEAAFICGTHSVAVISKESTLMPEAREEAGGAGQTERNNRMRIEFRAEGRQSGPKQKGSSGPAFVCTFH